MDLVWLKLLVAGMEWVQRMERLMRVDAALMFVQANLKTNKKIVSYKNAK